MKKVAIDIDGVVSNTPKIITEVLNQKGLKYEFLQYHPTIEGIEDTDAFMNEIVVDIFSNRMHEIEPYSDAKYELGNIVKFIGPITFVTARREDFRDNTLKWLNTHFPNVSFDLEHMPSGEKPDYLVENGFHFLIEDRLKTANTASSKGIKTFLLNRKWNMGRETHENITRISLFGTFFSLVASKHL